MCRNIKTLFNFDPPASKEEVRAASVQFVRKLSGFTKPSKVNEAVFEGAVDDVTKIAYQLLESLVTQAPPLEIVKLKAPKLVSGQQDASGSSYKFEVSSDRLASRASPLLFSGHD